MYTLTGEAYNTFVKIHNNILTPVRPDVIVTEDSRSGYYITRELFDCKVVSAYGKDKIYDVVSELNGVRYVVADGAGFGSVVERLLKLRDVYIFVPESFEFLMLCCYQFRKYCISELEHTEDYADTKRFYTWERYYTKLLKTICYNNWRVSYNKDAWDDLNDVFKTTSFLGELGSKFEDLQSILRDKYRRF